jgi:hypothetical protein
VSTAWEGLSKICPEWDKPEWHDVNWRRWPFLSCTADQGSDGVAGWHAMALKDTLQMNTSVFWDWSHGACNDLKGAYSANGLQPFVLLSLVCHNLAHGPERDQDMRYGQMKDSLQLFYETFTPETSDLFQHHAAKMIEELGTLLEIDDSAVPTAALWRFLKERMRFMTKGYRVSLCRFMAWIRGSRALLGQWTSTLFCCEFLALELDFLQGKAFHEKVLFKKCLVDEAVEHPTTSAGVPQVDAKVADAKTKGIWI